MSTERAQNVEDQAIAWCLRLHEGEPSAAEQQALDAWLAEDPAHRERFARMRRLWDGIALDAHAPELLPLRQQALAAAQAAGRRRWSSPRRHVAPWLSLAAALLLAVGVTLLLRDRATLYETRVGEQRAVVLADGSTMVLDADSAVRVRFSDDRRDLTLERGRASFKVAKNPLCPFAVTSGDSVVVAVGTAFSVERLSREMRVALYEGHVAVLRGRGRGFAAQLARIASGRESAEQALTPGHELILSEGVPDAILRSALVGDRPGSGQLSFANEPLTIAVQRVNRYNVGKPIAVAPQAADVRVSGLFNTGDTDAFVQGVVAAFPLTAVVSERDILLAPRRDDHTKSARNLPGTTGTLKSSALR
jgi:transmembrane sensor